MGRNREKVVVAMSGGVDSSVAACLLVEQGFDVMGLFMRVGSPRAADFRPRGRASGDEATIGSAGEAMDVRATKAATRTTDEVMNERRGAQGSALRRGDHWRCAAPSRDREGAVQTQERSHQGCCSASDAADARYVAGALGIPFYALNFERDFDRLIDYFADEYARGRTPNPCVVCNDTLKFGRIVEYADAVGAEYIATGHYARRDRRDNRSVLLRARDRRKDQSYVLFGLDRRVLDRVKFPIGDLTKPQVREIAGRYNLPNRDKPDSVEICFVPDRDYARIVRERRPDAFGAGDVLDAAGSVVGTHQGIGHYTIGQRRGLGIAASKPMYVTQLNVLNNTVTLGGADSLLDSALIADRANFLVDPPEGPFRAQVKIRYLHEPADATVERLADQRIRVVFDDPQRAITPGQAVVFYDGDLVLGGAWIERSE